MATSLSGVFPERLMLTMVLAVLLDTNDVVAEAGDAMDVDVTSSRSSKGASKDFEFVCWYYEKRQCGKFGLGVKSREASVFEASKRSLAEARCVDIVTVDLNTLKIGAVLLLKQSRDSGWNRFVCCSDCVRLFSLVLNEKLQVLCGSECSKGEGRAPKCVVLVRESENGKDVRSLGGSVGKRHESRCVLPLLLQRYRSVCIPRVLWNETGAGAKRSLRNSGSYSCACVP